MSKQLLMRVEIFAADPPADDGDTQTDSGTKGGRTKKLGQDKKDDE